MARYNQHCLGIFILFSLWILIIIIFIGRCFINYSQDLIIILRGVFDELYYLLSEIIGDKGVIILVLLPRGGLTDGHLSPIPYVFALNTARVYSIYDTTVIILELDDPILLQ